MTPERRKFWSFAALVAAAVLFAVAILIALNDLVHGGNWEAVTAGGLLAATIAALIERAP
jgi:hypothetical protein